MKPAVLALLLLAACKTLPDEPAPNEWPPFESASMGDMTNVHRVGDLWIGGLPARGDLELAARRGLTQVLDVRPAHQMPLEDLPAAARGHGLDYVSLAFDPEQPDPTVVERALAELRRPGSKLIFCNDGGGAALILAVHRVREQGVPLEEALSEARRLGMKPGAPEEFVRRAAGAP